MFKFRVIGFSLLIALLGGIFFWRPWGELLFIVSAPAMAALAVYECARMLNDSGRKNYPGVTALIFYSVSLIWCLVCGYGGSDLLLLFLAVPLLGCACWLRKDPELLERSLTSAGIFLLLSPALLLFLASFYQHTGNAPRGAWLLFLCLATKATDTGGYIVGTLTARLPGGNHKIAPGLSPKKSWEGLIGGILLSLLAGFLFYRFARYAPLWWYLTASGVLALGSFFGDLAESAVKRMCYIKDSGKWVPGMGGAFDVLDSFIFNGIVFYFLLWLIL